MHWYENQEISAEELLSHITFGKDGLVWAKSHTEQEELAALQNNPSFPLLALEDPRLIPVEWASYEEWSHRENRRLYRVRDDVRRARPPLEGQIERELESIVASGQLHPLMLAEINCYLDGYEVSRAAAEDRKGGVFPSLPELHQTLPAFYVAISMRDLFAAELGAKGYFARNRAVEYLQLAVSLLAQDEHYGYHEHLIYASDKRDPVLRYRAQQEEVRTLVEWNRRVEAGERLTMELLGEDFLRQAKEAHRERLSMLSCPNTLNLPLRGGHWMRGDS